MDIRTAVKEAKRRARTQGEPIALVHHVTDPLDVFDEGHYHYMDEETLQTTDNVATCEVTPTGEVF